MESTSSRAQPRKPCPICGGKAENTQFGADCCRACAAFFKRTVLLEKQYVCRQSTDNCDVSRDVRFTCRRCRFEKCLASGLLPEYVAEVASNADRSRKSESSLEASPSQGSLLDVISERYRIWEQIAVRTDDYVMRAEWGDRLLTSSGKFAATISLQNACVRASQQAMKDFTNNCFPELAEFDEEEKWLVLKNFMTSRFIFDGVHRAQRFFPGNDKIFMVTFNTFIDIDNMEFYISDLKGVFDKTHVVSIMRDFTTKCNFEWLGPLLKTANIDDVETMAIYGLLCWPAYLPNASERVRELSYSYHLRIFQDLHNHYEKTGVADYSSRVAVINSILMSVQAAIKLLKEDMQILRLLDVYNGNELVYNVVK